MTIIEFITNTLNLPFTNTIDHIFVDGWYLWRNTDNWPIHEYKFVEIASGKMRDEQPTDPYGAEWKSVWIDPYGQLAGPILDR